MGGWRVVDLELPPDVFAVVMATGIVAIAADDHRYGRIATALAVIATVTFVVLALCLGVQVIRRRGVFVAQLRDPDAALRMFTFVAAASVLGVLWRRESAAVWALAGLAVVGWTFLIPLGIRDVRSRPRTDLRDHARGAWLLVSVATSGMAVTAADLAMVDGVASLVAAGVALWLIALMLYCGVTVLVVARAVAGRLRPEVLSPDSWILMGALAIAALAGSHLARAASAVGSTSSAGWIDQVTIALWIGATVWIPVLLYATIWRVDRQPGSLRFAGVWWSAVFPLGMYAASTAATGTDLDLPALATVSLVFCWIAITVWAVVAGGLVQSAGAHWRVCRPPSPR